MTPLPAGAYESLRTQGLDDALLAAAPLVARWADLPDGDAPDVLARHVAGALVPMLRTLPPAARRHRINQLLTELDVSAETVVAMEQLVALTEPEAPGVHRLRPLTPLSDVALLTNARGEPSLGAELRAELASADRVDLLCAFIRWPGISVIADELDDLHRRGVPLRVITTTYRGATQRRAVDELVRRFGAEVKVRYDSRTTRLHAKAWLIRRDSGFDTGYVGSSNLSRSALLDGLEWNVRISAVATPTLVRQFEAAFETYWNDDDFRTYDPDRDAELLDRALAVEGGGDRGPSLVLSGLEVRPHPHQQRILEALDAEREVHDRHRNLVVAATGTGKTVVAALDYRALRARGAESLLFVAHRSEILQQALRTYREVLTDGTFGELFGGGHRPEHWTHVFANVQSLSNHDLSTLPPFDVMVIDEFHHAQAPTYRRLLDGVSAGELLGLTATPERGDNHDVRSFFDGRTAAELSLPDALTESLLCPFHYYGIADTTDLRAVGWSRTTGYDTAALTSLYTGTRARTAIVLKTVAERVTDPHTMRALGFCVSVAHAEYMAQQFTAAGLPSEAVHGTTPADQRARLQQALRRGEVRCLFAVDLFNEGVDLPEVDTLLLLRPTESVTVFVQQLGRGLRWSADKPVLTVLDFIGQHRREYRMDLRLRALTGSPRGRIERDVEEGFPYLPSGSQLLLDRVARQVVLDNVRAAQSGGGARRELVSEARALGTPELGRFLTASGLELGDVYRRGASWTDVVIRAGLPRRPSGPDHTELLKRAHVLAHVDDPDRAAAYRRLLRADDHPGQDPRYARMLAHALWPGTRGRDAADALARLRHNEDVCAELDMLLSASLDAARHVPQPLGGALGDVPLRSHARYRKDELLVALGWTTGGRVPENHREGVAWCDTTGVDALLVTLRKDDGFSPSTRYRDYPISADLFHWESQNRTTCDSPTGRRYLTGGSSVVLFVREHSTDEIGAAPYTCLGLAEHVSHVGERPIAITWRLHRAMPAELLRAGQITSV